MVFLKGIALIRSAWASDIRYSSQAQKATSMAAARISAYFVNAVALSWRFMRYITARILSSARIVQAVKRRSIDALSGLWQRVTRTDKELAQSGEPHGI
jgi:hypothetical protein